MTTLYNDISAWQQCREQEYFQGKTIGFVPTMGYLHQGHASLIERSVAENVFTVVSIFVNPLQFDETHDMETYPCDINKDYELARRLGVDFVLQPEVQAMYPKDYSYKVTENALSNVCEGQVRSGHFDGMLTIVMKLFNLVKPQRAYFGEKDYQQLQLVHGLVKAFHLPIEVIGCATVREADGLAMSSRNVNLSIDQRARAPQFHDLLASSLPIAEIRKQLEVCGFVVDYIEEHHGRRLGAVRLGKVRLIDNVEM